MALLFIIGIILWIWAEIAAFIAIGGEFGAILTIIGIFVTAMVGMWLLRTQGRAVMASLQGQVSRGEAPVTSVAAGVSILGGAVLMLIPGYLTDAAGLIMFMPVIRTVIGAMLLKWVTSRGGFMMRAESPFARSPFARSPFGQGRAGAQNFGSGPFGEGGFHNSGTEDGFAKHDFGPGRAGRGGAGRDHAKDDDIIEGEFEERDHPKRRIDRPSDNDKAGRDDHE